MQDNLTVILVSEL